VIALDTNVLVRYLVQDNEKQAEKAKALIGRLGEDEERAYVSEIVLCELVWVLTRSYGLERKQIALTLSQLLAARQLSFDSVDDVTRALTAYAGGNGDFADYLIREHARAAGCDGVVTFDKKLLKEELFAAL
jgi:predicted nucleic-acid-binding protein